MVLMVFINLIYHIMIIHKEMRYVKMTKYPPDNDFEKLLQEKSQTLSKLCPDHKSYFDIYYHKYGDNDYKIKIPLAAIQYDEDMDDISDIIKFKKM